jgi:hypothetical protein
MELMWYIFGAKLKRPLADEGNKGHFKRHVYYRRNARHQNQMERTSVAECTKLIDRDYQIGWV